MSRTQDEAGGQAHEATRAERQVAGRQQLGRQLYDVLVSEVAKQRVRPSRRSGSERAQAVSDAERSEE